ncbi:MAG: hypothetical protein WBG90_00125 [Saonia sp.]
MSTFLISCKQSRQESRPTDQKVDNQEEIRVSVFSFSEVIESLKIESLPFSYNNELLRKFEFTATDESIIEELLLHDTEKYYECEKSVRYKYPLILNDSLLSYIGKNNPFEIQSCKIIKRFWHENNFNVLLASSSMDEREFILCMTYKNDTVHDYRLLSKVVVPDEYNYFGITISEKFLIESVNYSRYEEPLTMEKRKLKINDDASITVLNEGSFEFNDNP